MQSKGRGPKHLSEEIETHSEPRSEADETPRW